MLTSLIGIHGILHAHIRAFHFIHYGLGKNGNIPRFVAFRFLALQSTEFQKIIPELKTVLQKPVVGILLGSSSFDKIFGIHFFGFIPNIWIISFFKYLRLALILRITSIAAAPCPYIRWALNDRRSG
jgi:hypothetical protein